MKLVSDSMLMLLGMLRSYFGFSFGQFVLGLSKAEVPEKCSSFKVRSQCQRANGDLRADFPARLRYYDIALDEFASSERIGRMRGS
jgi:hypothetical protein